VTDSKAVPYQPGKDTRPLSPTDLSPTELEIIRKIEGRISDVRTVGRPAKRDRVEDYLARAQQRYRRVLLLDGDRGTGKTSFLVTLVERWNVSAEYDDVVGAERPDFIRVLPILDFDPLPPGVPLAAWIIQAWRPLVNHYEEISRKSTNGRESEDDTLLDRWLKLFRVAAVGWTGIPQGTGLIEQVLDREEQVGDWQHLDRQWYDFVEDVIEFGTNGVPQAAGPLPKNPVFVIMIDDVDLQVGRVRELLPALRLLYHPSVVFVVAAYRKHLIDMLALDFLGQQNELARCAGPSALSLWGDADADRWAGDLALSTFQKVFAKPDLWRLEPLSLSEWLEFPGKQYTFRDVLNGRGKPLKAGVAVEPKHNDEPLGDYVRTFAKLREKQGVGAATFMTYRKAQQLADEIFTATDPKGMRNATALLCRLLDPTESEIGAVPSADGTPVVEFLRVGEVTALFSPELVEVISPKLHEIVLSGRPSFRFRAEDGSRVSSENRVQHGDMPVTMALLAISLQDSNRSVVAPGLKWEARLSLAWTRWAMSDHAVDAIFRWPLHVLPTPLRLFEWAGEWADFIRGLAGEARDRRDRMAYGWIFYQLRWLGGQLTGVDDPAQANLEDVDVWNRLLAKEPPADTDVKLGKDRWRRRTLPLLARPEIGFTPKVQKRLLAVASTKQSSKGLIAERRRLVRDAFDAAAAEKGESATGGAEEDARVDAVLAAVDLQYAGAPWYDFIKKLRGSKPRA
jgi:hypothetical protein